MNSGLVKWIPLKTMITELNNQIYLLDNIGYLRIYLWIPDQVRGSFETIITDLIIQILF